MAQDYAHYAEMDLKRSASARENQTQDRETGLMKRSSDFDKVVEDQFTKMSSNPAWMHNGRSGKSGKH